MNRRFRYSVAIAIAILFVFVIASNVHASLLLGSDPLPEAPKNVPVLAGAERVGVDFAAGRHAMKEHLYHEALAHFSSALEAAPNREWKTSVRGAMGDAHLAIAVHERMEGRRESQRRHAAKASEFYRALRQRDVESFPAKRALWKMGQAMMMLQMHLEAEGWLEHAAGKLSSEGPYRIPVQLARAQNYLEWGKFQAAETIFGQVMDSGAGEMDMADAVFGAATALHGLKEYRRAYAYFTGGMKQWSNRLLRHPQLLFAFGETAMVAQEYSRARWAYLSVYNRYPNSEPAATALARIGDTYRFQDEPHAAACFYQQAITSPKYSEWRLLGLMGKARLSATLIRNDSNDSVGIPNLPCEGGAVDTEEALQQIYREAIAIAPEHSLAKAARMGLAESLSVTGHSREAIAEYKPLVLEIGAHPWKADAGKKLDAEIRTLINEHTEQGDDLRIVELYYQYRSVLSLEQQDDGIQVQVAASLQRVGLLHSAMKVYPDVGDTDKVSTRDVQAAQAPDPTDGEATVELLALSDRLYRSKNFEAALRSYRRLLAREGEENTSAVRGADRDWVEYRVGRCLTSLDQVIAAKKAFRQLIDRDTGSHVAILAAAYLAQLELQS